MTYSTKMLNVIMCTITHHYM